MHGRLRKHVTSVAPEVEDVGDGPHERTGGRRRGSQGKHQTSGWLNIRGYVEKCKRAVSTQSRAIRGFLAFESRPPKTTPLVEGGRRPRKTEERGLEGGVPGVPPGEAATSQPASFQS